MNVRRSAAILAAITVILTSCGGGSDDDTTPDATATASSTPGAATGAGDTQCLLGRWYLDTDDYAAQALDYVVGLGVPMDSLEITGNQILDFNESPYMSISTDLQLDGVVKGQALSVTSQNAGGGEWGWNGDSDTDIGVDNWEWTAEAEGTPEGAPPLIDPSDGIAVDCSADRLTVQGSGAPLVGVFVRR